MQLSDSNYAIHGTDEPESIGKDESLGCIRMSRKDVEELFAMVPMGTKVQISKGVCLMNCWFLRTVILQKHPLIRRTPIKSTIG